MKKNSILTVLFSTLLVALGISSCSKTKDCIEVDRGDDVICGCIEDAGSKEEFNAYIKLYKLMGYKVKYVDSCPEETE